MKLQTTISAVAYLALAACATVPYTHRHQFNLISPQEEMKMGDDAYADTLKKTPLSKNEEYQRRVKEVGRRIAAAANQPDFKWEFNVLSGKEINAFCLPGGKVAFWDSIIPVCETDAGIAVVMGHEVAHAIARHGAERMTQSIPTQLGAELVSAKLGAGAVQAYGLVAQYGFLNPFSRSHESEADHIGLILMAKAGYDPHAAVQFWQRMEKSGGQKPPEFLSTHPADSRRVSQIQSWMDEALSHYKP